MYNTTSDTNETSTMSRIDSGDVKFCAVIAAELFVSPLVLVVD